MHIIMQNKYQLIRPLGSGGQGSVYLVRDLHIDKIWAMKLFLMRKPEWKQSKVENTKSEELHMQSEIVALCKVRHERLPMLSDAFIVSEKIAKLLISKKKEDICIAMIMEYIDGINLEMYLQKYGPLSEKEVLRWGIQIVEVLEYLHGRHPAMIHGDIKPANLLITQDKNIKLVDFGSAITESDTKNKKNAISKIMGTRGYLAPELLQRGKAVDTRCDIYSLGITLYYMITGRNPNMPGFELQPIRRTDSSLSVGIERIIERCTRENPEKRYQTCSEIKKDLTNYKKTELRYQGMIMGIYILYEMTTLGAVWLPAIEINRYIANAADMSHGLLVTGIICAAAALIIRKFLLERSVQNMHFYRQEISILRTDKEKQIS